LPIDSRCPILPPKGAFNLLVSLFCRSLGYEKAFRLLRSRRSLRSLRSLRSRRSLRIAGRTTIAVVIAVHWRVPGVLKPFPSYSACKVTPWDHLSAPRNPVFPHFHVAHADDAGGAGDHPEGVPIALGPLPSYSACKTTPWDLFLARLGDVLAGFPTPLQYCIKRSQNR
jgi:hypothetical protein